ncbi:hypothetical protein CRU99_07750 [Malaciobacter mytili]|uniref:hypothetical protein n=1 Tax=Malaciobacter mytili TaxID=603050 RepID=UPI00100B3EA7|nr:hypothetical protein [Malaciobacter mytili]RXI43419.1 hypothetical protein CRU99_07750 [Malaciobacter mytili]
MKKIKMFFLGLSLFVSNLFASSEIENFKKGFVIGLEAVEYQLNTEGFEPKKINLKNPYIVSLDIQKATTNDILYFQHLLKKYEGLNSILTKKFIVIKSFERIPDAQLLSNQINQKYNINTEVKELSNGEIETYPILFSKTFEPLIKAFAQKADVKIVTQYKTPLQIKLEDKKTSNIPKYFTLKNSSMSYKYKYDKQKEKLDCKKQKRCFDSKLFYENKIFENGKKFQKGGVYKTIDGELFQKVYQKNLFFEYENIK